MKRIINFLTAGIFLLLLMAGCSASIPKGMALIKGGSFIMGSPETDPDYVNWEGPQHEVTISSFYMGKHEVTQQEYQSITGNNPSDNHEEKAPVDTVSWYSAVQYCNTLSERERLSAAYTISDDTVTWNHNANGYRLPTEAEWEYACRGGTTTPYYTGASITLHQACFGVNLAIPVGSFEPNPFGLYDMSGNVYEWCWDWYGNYDAAAQTNPVGAATGALRVIRGGSAGSDAQHLRSTERGRTDPSTLNVYLGFRVVRDAK